MKAKYFKNNAYILRVIWKIKKGRVIGEFCHTVLSYVYWVFYDIIFLKYLVIAFENGKTFAEILLFLLISLVGFFVPSILNACYVHIYKPKSDVDINESLNNLLFNKARQVELECYENTEFYNHFILAMKDCEQRLARIIENLCAIVASTIASFVAVYHMFQIDAYVIVFIAGPIIGNFVFGKMINEVKFQKNKECVQFYRKLEYVNRVVYLVDYAKELRMSQVFSVLKSIYEDGYQNIVKKIDEYSNKQIVLSFLRNLFTFVIIFQGVIIYSLYRVLESKTMTISGFTVLFSAMTAVAWMVINASKAIINSYDDSLYIANLKEFLEYKPKIHEKQDGILPIACEQKNVDKRMLVYHKVGFTYGGKQVPALKGIDLTIYKNEKIAIVGNNGSGKTTFVKLLLRLYDVDEGEILYYGENVKKLNLPEYRKVFGVAFQDYQIFSISVAENILMRKPINVSDYDKVKECLEKVGLYDKICKLPQGMDTILTKEFAEDGIVFSGGELQKIAVARVFAKDYKIAIFDEPSSALDPVAEHQFYESIFRECYDKTVVFISHRLSTTIWADKICLFENGEIVEQGSHKELMQKNRKYAEMFRMQAKNYSEGSTNNV